MNNKEPVLPYIPECLDSLGRNPRPRARCTNQIHLQAKGWCPDCDSSWNRLSEITEEQYAESYTEQIDRYRQTMVDAQADLERLKKQEPRDIVAIVDARKRRNTAREELTNLGYSTRPAGYRAVKGDRD